MQFFYMENVELKPSNFLATVNDLSKENSLLTIN